MATVAGTIVAVNVKEGLQPVAGLGQQAQAGKSQSMLASRVAFQVNHGSLAAKGAIRCRGGVGNRRRSVVTNVATSNSSSATATKSPAEQGSSRDPNLATVLVAEKLGDGGLDLLRKVANVDCTYNLTNEELCEKISNYDALIVRSATKVTRQVFQASNGRLKVVGRAGVGIDNVDLDAATELGCLVVNAPTANTVAAAEHGIALLAAMARNVAPSDASMKNNNWERSKYVGVSLVDKTLAVMGFGKVGSEVARKAKGLGMHVISHDPYASADRARALGVDLVTFDDALARADFISLHMPLTPTTDKLFNDATLSKCKPGVRLINVARGGVIDEPALLRALNSGLVSQAALDVFTTEPPKEGDSSYALIQHKNVIATPHLGASTIEAQEGVAVEIAEAVAGALAGELAATAVNAPMVPAEVIAELAPYVTLAEKLGRLAVQLVAGGAGVKQVKVVYESARDLDTRLLRAMITKGLIEPVSSAFINLVNADYVAKQRGLKISEERERSDGSTGAPLESVSVTIADVDSRFASATGDATRSITLEGKVKDGVAHLSKVGSFRVDVSLEGSIILYRQVDQPGMIGKVGTILGEDNVNIAFMSVGRTLRGLDAIVAIGTDEDVSKPALQKLTDIPAIGELVFLKL
jgi:D-3-phosphoglycerate dehydrogenase